MLPCKVVCVNHMLESAWEASQSSPLAVAQLAKSKEALYTVALKFAFQGEAGVRGKL